MEQVSFTPVGIALKQHELYGLDDNLLFEQATNLRNDIIGWSMENFILDDRQIDWMNQQDDSFTIEFSKTISDGLIGRYDFNIQFSGPSEVWKSKRVSAKASGPVKTIDIFVEKYP
ncbi:hypothetical protein [Sphingobacterium detergens]|uniref:Uncharacterized protein n=1 Tax=Sphingobacterium detergens TaxID=1145106 RepID=A0A420B6U6_SPHD1|nr:hypothetical protein [Sphingobacterium detergens]RKE52392.1 hypothetical protein DFQ12_2628 [Sphingobacterium detergens]